MLSDAAEPRHAREPDGDRTIMIAGHWRWDIYEEALANGFRSIGWRVVPFRFDNPWEPASLSGTQVRLKHGPLIRRLNRRLLKSVEFHAPTAVLLYSSDLVFPSTVDHIGRRRAGSIVLLYHNDDPYVGFRNHLKWRHFLGSVQKADAVLVYRPANISDASRAGARRVALLPPHYLTYRHRPMPPAGERERCDVVFIGHYEADERAGLLDYLANNGIQVRVYGAGWEAAASRFSWIDPALVRPVLGEDYSRQLCSARIALALLSSANRDVWTRRCFEIPACRIPMVTPRTAPLEALFLDGQEAVFFDAREDLLTKVRHMLASEAARERIAEAGWKRCVEGEHHEIGRARQVAQLIEELGGERPGWKGGRA